jgi:hypothetical protein
MTEDRSGAPNLSTPNVARIYDFMLGGKDNYECDREVASQLFRDPRVRPLVRANRRFLIRAVRYLVEEVGIRQFLDIGAGLPTQENVHEVAHRYAPEVRVVYVDNDPVVQSHARALLESDNVTIVGGDLRRPAEILELPAAREMINFAEPLGVLLVAVLHFIPDDDHPYDIVTTLRNAMAPGSYLVVSHGTADEAPADNSAKAAQEYQSTNASLALRSRSQCARFFDGLDLVSPGLVGVREWRPDLSTQADGPVGRAAGPVGSYVGVGYKPYA